MAPARFYRENGAIADARPNEGAAAFVFERADGLFDVQILDEMRPTESRHAITRDELDVLLRERRLRPVDVLG